MQFDLHSNRSVMWEFGTIQTSRINLKHIYNFSLMYNVRSPNVHLVDNIFWFGQVDILKFLSKLYPYDI